MREPAYYRGREQTYIKHFFLEKYLERVVYNIASFRDTFVFVDGFSGPWRSSDEALADTSFAIAIEQLRQAKSGVKERFGKDLTVRCLFNEADPKAFSELQIFCDQIDDIIVEPRNVPFEDLVPELIEFIGTDFSLTFIDPTGLSGFGMEAITPLLKLPGEVIVNFMMDYANRFIENEKASRDLKLDQTFGDDNWLEEVYKHMKAGFSRETSILQTYRKRFKRAGRFPFATSTRILYPEKDRTYFHLVYGTGHRKGIEEFRNVERASVKMQERIRSGVKLAAKEIRTGQSSFLGELDEEDANPNLAFEEEQRANRAHAEKFIRARIRNMGRILYQDLDAVTMQIPLVWRSTFNQILLDLKSEGLIKIEGLEKPQRSPKPGHTLINLGL